MTTTMPAAATPNRRRGRSRRAGSHRHGDEGTPVPGGEIIYGLEAETAAGWCLPEAQLAISGIQVARTIYDTLTMPDENGEIKPYLAESVEPATTTNDVWTIKLREGITFHDGTAARRDRREEQPRRVPRARTRPARRCCSSSRSQDIASVDVVDPLTVTVTTKRPWVVVPVVPVGQRARRHDGPGAARLRRAATTTSSAPVRSCKTAGPSTTRSSR